MDRIYEYKENGWGYLPRKGKTTVSLTFEEAFALLVDDFCEEIKQIAEAEGWKIKFAPENAIQDGYYIVRPRGRSDPEHYLHKNFNIDIYCGGWNFHKSRHDAFVHLAFYPLIECGKIVDIE